jgi:hypothetical protein
VPVDLSPTFDLHRCILSELELREAATKEQETEARRALDSALHGIAAERREIKQCRDLLTQAATLYQSFVGKDRVTTQTDVPQPTEAPFAGAAPEETSQPVGAGEAPLPRATEAPSPYAKVRQPTEAPFATASSEQTSVVAGEGPSPLAAGEPAPDATPVPGASIEAESFARVENLRSEITAETGRGGGGSWWAGMWRRGTRDDEVELSWKEAYPPVEGAERAIWDHNHPSRTQE